MLKASVLSELPESALCRIIYAKLTYICHYLRWQAFDSLVFTVCLR